MMKHYSTIGPHFCRNRLQAQHFLLAEYIVVDVIGSLVQSAPDGLKISGEGFLKNETK